MDPITKEELDYMAWCGTPDVAAEWAPGGIYHSGPLDDWIAYLARKTLARGEK